MDGVLTKKEELWVNVGRATVRLWMLLCKEKYIEIQDQSKGLSGGKFWRECFDNSNFLVHFILKKRKNFISHSI